MLVLAPDLLYRDGRFQGGLALRCDAESGRIDAVGTADELTDDRQHVVERLPGRALMPGFVNAHSHAFQRLIRGRTQWRPAYEEGADFWSWREAMYGAALRLTADDIFQVSRFCFLEMIRAGFTAVGEFHYLHMERDGRRYADWNELAHRVLDAANEVGIRIALLNVCYVNGGIGEPLRPEQRRFATPTLDGYLAATEALIEAPAARSTRVSIGVAPHSVRAVPASWLAVLHAFATEHDLPFHMHVSEQPAEVEACEAAYGLRPVELLVRQEVLDPRLTAVHATHVSDTEVRLLGDAGVTVCACPTTERDLGDGFLRGRDLLDAGATLALGSDSQTIIDPFAEMRLVEYHERLQRLRRVVLTRQEGDRLVVAPALLEMAMAGGARALRLDAGTLEPGRLADLVAIDLTHPALAGWSDDSLAAHVALSGTAALVSDVWVAGKRRVADSRHRLDGEALGTFEAVARRVGTG